MICAILMSICTIFACIMSDNSHTTLNVMIKVSAFSADLSASLLTVAALGTSAEKNEGVGGSHEVEAEIHLSQQVRCH